jgi:hypothetical protein
MRPPDAKRRPGGGGAAVLSGNGDMPSASFSQASHLASPPQAALRRDPRFRRLTEQLHRLGVRAVAECLLEVATGRDLIETSKRSPSSIRHWSSGLGHVTGRRRR